MLLIDLQIFGMDMYCVYKIYTNLCVHDFLFQHVNVVDFINYSSNAEPALFVYLE